MALDLEKLKSKLAALKNPDSKQFKSQTWKPPQQDGETKKIRLVQYPFSSDPFVELWFHYNIGKQSILCPRKNDGRPCPICEFAHTLWESKDEKDHDLAKMLSPTQRVYAVVLDRDDATMEPKYWGFGVTIYQKLIEALVNPRTRHMMEVDAGIDIIVSTVKKDKKKYRETDFALDGEDTPLANPEATKKFIAAVKPINEVFKPVVAAEIKKLLDNWLNTPVDNPEQQSSETEKGGSVRASKEETSNAKNNIQDIDEMFEQAIKRK